MDCMSLVEIMRNLSRFGFGAILAGMFYICTLGDVCMDALWNNFSWFFGHRIIDILSLMELIVDVWVTAFFSISFWPQKYLKVNSLLWLNLTHFWWHIFQVNMINKIFLGLWGSSDVLADRDMHAILTKVDMLLLQGTSCLLICISGLIKLTWTNTLKQTLPWIGL